MYLVYLDESGDPTLLPRSNTPFYIISAFILEPSLMRLVEEKIIDIKRYLEDIGIVTAKMEELKGSEIWRRIKKKYEGT